MFLSPTPTLFSQTKVSRSVPSNSCVYYRYDQFYQIDQMNNWLERQYKPQTEISKHIVNELFKLATGITNSNIKFDNLLEFVSYGLEIFETNIISGRIDNSNPHRRNVGWLYNIAIQLLSLREFLLYHGYIDRQYPDDRLAEHRLVMKKYLGTDCPTKNKSDALIAENMTSESIFYHHIKINNVTTRDIRVLEDVTLICLERVFGKGGLINANTGASRTNFNRYDIDSDQKIWALGAWLIPQLIDVPQIQINVYEETKMTVDHPLIMACPMDECVYVTTKMCNFVAHFKSRHGITDRLDVEILLAAVKKLQCKFCKRNFITAQYLLVHEKECPFNSSVIRCDRVKYGCTRAFETEDEMKQHMANECLYKEKTREKTHPCGNASNGCSEMFGRLYQRDAHMKNSCDFRDDGKIAPEKCIEWLSCCAQEQKMPAGSRTRLLPFQSSGKI